jgi:hypothetical protein
LVLHDFLEELSDGILSSYLCIGTGIVTLNLQLDPLFLEVGQQMVLINLLLFLVKRVDDYFDEQVRNEEGAEDHIQDEDLLVHDVYVLLRLHAYAH